MGQILHLPQHLKMDVEFSIDCRERHFVSLNLSAIGLQKDGKQPLDNKREVACIRMDAPFIGSRRVKDSLGGWGKSLVRFGENTRDEGQVLVPEGAVANEEVGGGIEACGLQLNQRLDGKPSAPKELAAQRQEIRMTSFALNPKVVVQGLGVGMGIAVIDVVAGVVGNDFLEVRSGQAGLLSKLPGQRSPHAHSLKRRVLMELAEDIEFEQWALVANVVVRFELGIQQWHLLPLVVDLKDLQLILRRRFLPCSSSFRLSDRTGTALGVDGGLCSFFWPGRNRLSR